MKASQYPRLQHFRVPNTWYGRLLLWAMRKYLGTQYTFVLRGRIPVASKLREYERQKQYDALAKFITDGPRYPGQPEPELREYTDVQLRRAYHQSCPWSLCRDIGVYIVHTPKARKLVDAWKAEQYTRGEAFRAQQQARVVTDALKPALNYLVEAVTVIEGFGPVKSPWCTRVRDYLALRGREMPAYWDVPREVVVERLQGPSDLGTGAANADAIIVTPEYPARREDRSGRHFSGGDFHPFFES